MVPFIMKLHSLSLDIQLVLRFTSSSINMEIIVIYLVIPDIFFSILSFEMFHIFIFSMCLINEIQLSLTFSSRLTLFVL